MTECSFTIPCSPGDKLWAIVGEQVRCCEVEKVILTTSKSGLSVHLDILFIAPNPFAKGQMKEYHDFAILGRRAPAYRAAYETEEEAKQALENEGPDYH